MTGPGAWLVVAARGAAPCAGCAARAARDHLGPAQGSARAPPTAGVVGVACCSLAALKLLLGLRRRLRRVWLHFDARAIDTGAEVAAGAVSPTVPGLRAKLNAMTPNPGQLKFDLAVRGARLGDGVADHPDLQRLPADADYAVRSIECVLPEEVWVSVPVGDRAGRPVPLRAARRRRHVRGRRRRRALRGAHRAAAALLRRDDAHPAYRCGASAAPRAAIWRSTRWPAARPRRAAFRAASAPAPSRRRRPMRRSPSPTSSTPCARRSRKGQSNSSTLHLGHVEGDERRYRVPRALRARHQAALRHAGRGAGAAAAAPTAGSTGRTPWASTAISYSVEIHDAELLARHRAGRAGAVGRARYYDALRHAATIFPSGTVWSDLIVGLEPPESTMAGIDALVEIGVLPVLSLFRPLDDSALPRLIRCRPPPRSRPSSRTCSTPCASRASTCTGCAT